MAEKATDELIPPTCSSIPVEDPPTTTADGSVEKPTETTTDTDFDTTVLLVHQPNKRRRKNCPTSLDQFETIIKQQSDNSSLSSFTFDTPFRSTPDSTPKFGSFDSGVNRCSTQQQIITVGSEVTKTRSEDYDQEEEEKSEERGELISSVDGVVESTSVD